MNVVTTYFVEAIQGLVLFTFAEVDVANSEHNLYHRTTLHARKRFSNQFDFLKDAKS